MIGEDWTPRQRLRAVQSGAAAAAVGLHLLALLFIRPEGRLALDGPDPHPPFVVTLVSPSRPDIVVERPAPARRSDREDDRPVVGPNPRSLPRIDSLDGQTSPPRNPGPPGRSGPPGIVWGGDPAQDAARRALRGAAGCGLDMPLTRREQNGCDERMGRDWRKAPRTSPLMADRSRQRQLEAEADYRDRLKRWKEDSPPAGTGIFGGALGEQPPRPPPRK